MLKSMYIALIITLVLHTFSGTLHIYMVFYLSKAYYNFCLLKTLIITTTAICINHKYVLFPRMWVVWWRCSGPWYISPTLLSCTASAERPFLCVRLRLRNYSAAAGLAGTRHMSIGQLLRAIKQSYLCCPNQTARQPAHLVWWLWPEKPEVSPVYGGPWGLCDLVTRYSNLLRFPFFLPACLWIVSCLYRSFFFPANWCTIMTLECVCSSLPRSHMDTD